MIAAVYLLTDELIAAGVSVSDDFVSLRKRRIGGSNSLIVPDVGE